jgi:IclR family acetate operon transcriptional repressor
MTLPSFNSIDIAERENSANRSLERALHLLMILESSITPQSLTELASATQLAKATVQRILAVLEKYSLVERKLGRYHLGAAVLPLAHAYLLGNSLSRAALPVLQDLAVATDETASLFVRLGYYRVVVHRVEGKHPLRYILPIGQRLPLHAGVGKVLAAAMEEEDLSRMLDELGELRRAKGVCITRTQFLDELEKIRKQGYAVSHNEREFGMASVAAPVTDSDGAVVAAVSIAGPMDRLVVKEGDLIVEICRAARAISDRYGRM